MDQISAAGAALRRRVICARTGYSGAYELLRRSARKHASGGESRHGAVEPEASASEAEVHEPAARHPSDSRKILYVGRSHG